MMKRTIQLVSLAAAAAVIVGCSSTRNESASDNNPSNPTPGTSYNTSGGNASDANSTASASETSSQEQASAQDQNASGTKSGFLGMGGKEVTIDQLPQAAQTSIRNQIGDQQIAKIREETKDGQTAYKVELQKKNWHSMRPDLIVAADGSIIKESHLQKVNEAAGAQTPQAPSQANPSGSLPTSSTNAPSSNPQQ